MRNKRRLYVAAVATAAFIVGACNPAPTGPTVGPINFEDADLHRRRHRRAGRLVEDRSYDSRGRHGCGVRHRARRLRPRRAVAPHLERGDERLLRRPDRSRGRAPRPLARPGTAATSRPPGSSRRRATRWPSRKTSSWRPAPTTARARGSASSRWPTARRARPTPASSLPATPRAWRSTSGSTTMTRRRPIRSSGSSSGTPSHRACPRQRSHHQAPDLVLRRRRQRRGEGLRGRYDLRGHAVRGRTTSAWRRPVSLIRSTRCSSTPVRRVGRAWPARATASSSTTSS